MPHDGNAHLDTAAAPGGELGGTWASPTVDATHSGSAHHAEDHDHDGTPTQTLLASRTHGSPSEDTHHAKVHGEAEHSAAVKTLRKRKSSDETITLSLTLQDDDDLFFAVGANEVWGYEIRFVVISPATADFRFNFSAPSGAAGWFGIMGITTVGSYGGADLTVSTTGVDQIRFLHGVIANGGTAGDLKWQWAQQTVDAGNTIIRANAYLIAHRIA